MHYDYRLHFKESALHIMIIFLQINHLMTCATIWHNNINIVIVKLNHKIACNSVSLHSPHVYGMDFMYSPEYHTLKIFDGKKLQRIWQISAI